MESQILLLIGLLLSFTGGLLITINVFGLSDFLEIIEYEDNEPPRTDLESIYDNEYIARQEKKAQSRVTQISYNAAINTTCTYLFFNIIISLIAHFYFNLSLFLCLILFCIWHPLWKALLAILNKSLDYIETNQSAKIEINLVFFKVVIHIIGNIFRDTIYGLITVLLLLLDKVLDVFFAFIGEKIIAKLLLKLLKFTYHKTIYATYSKFNEPLFRGTILILIGFLYQVASVLWAIFKA